uniref:UDP-N-acetylglucosamine--N-acetylmuramyl-(Pentapeptide) pyrophosphoryl-undecaprenol N-acetylglucosamine transferase n=1 Tax=Lygus hesperus TaxID=30085 RepID=A0A0A9XBY5_LYGHE
MPDLVDEKRERIDRFWNDEYLKKLNTAICLIQDWFTKISFKNKTAFMKKLVQVMADSKKLFDVAYFIGPPLKDTVYARAQFTRSPYDVAATDHNRSIEDHLVRGSNGLLC